MRLADINEKIKNSIGRNSTFKFEILLIGLINLLISKISSIETQNNRFQRRKSR